jgi:hypothetical protein
MEKFGNKRMHKVKTMVRQEDCVVTEDSIPPLESEYGQLSRYLQLSCCCCFCCGIRWTIAVLIMFGFFISYGIRCNVGVAVIKMVSNETEHGDLIELGESLAT